MNVPWDNDELRTELWHENPIKPALLRLSHLFLSFRGVETDEEELGGVEEEVIGRNVQFGFKFFEKIPVTPGA
ncbi:hypothetical protein COLO4_06440 [Corchorus olitorius]|uniref:Uncharacterized protein n=1 Tax=Corchorus olitorius TaxID=93759 RepID=A0A1R3KN16_9ROSI|nr:hypothetical protein COLO4_06440 [Corchorus olitorius]